MGIRRGEESDSVIVRVSERSPSGGKIFSSPIHHFETFERNWRYNVFTEPYTNVSRNKLIHFHLLIALEFIKVVMVR